LLDDSNRVGWGHLQAGSLGESVLSSEAYVALSHLVQIDLVVLEVGQTARLLLLGALLFFLF